MLTLEWRSHPCADDERLDDLLDRLEQKHPDVLTVADLQALGAARVHNPMEVVSAELDKTRCGIEYLERRLKGICCPDRC